jgi:hypothetical protein
MYVVVLRTNQTERQKDDYDDRHENKANLLCIITDISFCEHTESVLGLVAGGKSDGNHIP